MNISEILNDYLIDNVLADEGIEIIYNDVFPFDDGFCLISRYDPTTAKEKEFIDGSVVGSQQLSYFIRSEDAADCRRILDLITDKVDNLSCSNNDGIEIRFTCLTHCAFVSIDDKNQTIYTATLKADYDKPGE